MRTKYNNTKTIVDGIKFDSKKEAKRYQELKLLQRAKVITDLRLQVPFVLVDKNSKYRAVKYIADFTYNENGSPVVEDVKGVKTTLYTLKKKLMYSRYGIEIKET